MNEEDATGMVNAILAILILIINKIEYVNEYREKRHRYYHAQGGASGSCFVRVRCRSFGMHAIQHVQLEAFLSLGGWVGVCGCGGGGADF